MENLSLDLEWNKDWDYLTKVKRPSRYIGGEWGLLPPKDDEENIISLCLAYPDVYEVGMSYLGYQILYFLVKSLDFADVDRVYAPCWGLRYSTNLTQLTSSPCLTYPLFPFDLPIAGMKTP